PLSQAESRRWVRGVKPVVSEYIDANRTQGVNPEKAVRDLQASIKAFGKKKFSSYRQYKQSTGVK
ncbi:MAG: hypothetical protein M0P04_08745, partial [Syntrophales bacterium]|nr:hypothetical protein [Syntrophales bacterium]